MDIFKIDIMILPCKLLVIIKVTSCLDYYINEHITVYKLMITISLEEKWLRFCQLPWRQPMDDVKGR